MCKLSIEMDKQGTRRAVTMDEVVFQQWVRQCRAQASRIESSIAAAKEARLINRFSGNDIDSLYASVERRIPR